MDTQSVKKDMSSDWSELVSVLALQLLVGFFTSRKLCTRVHGHKYTTNLNVQIGNK